MPTATTTFPQYEKAVRRLVEHHRKLKDERLLLAVYFNPQRKPVEDVCLFEILEGFGPDEPDPEDADLDRAIERELAQLAARRPGSAAPQASPVFPRLADDPTD